MTRRELLLAALMAATACAPSPSPSPDRSAPGQAAVAPSAERTAPALEAQARADASERRVLAEVTNRTPPIGVQVLEARRVAADTLRIELSVANLAEATAAPAERDAVQAAIAAIAGLSLMTDDGHRRFFPLHDSAGRMAWSGLEAPEPGQRRACWVLFPAPDAAAATTRVTLVVPGLPAVRGIPVSK